MVAELLGVIPGRLCFDRGIRETPGASLCGRDKPEVKDPGRDPKAHGEPHAVPSPRVQMEMAKPLLFKLDDTFKNYNVSVPFSRRRRKFLLPMMAEAAGSPMRMPSTTGWISQS